MTTGLGSRRAPKLVIAGIAAALSLGVAATTGATPTTPPVTAPNPTTTVPGAPTPPRPMAADRSHAVFAPDGCPTTPPVNTLRGPVAELLGLYRICLDSVRDARSPEAVLAIRFALSEIGTPYSQPLRNQPHIYDCSSFVSRAYQAAGVPIAYPDTPERVDGGPGQNTPGSRFEAAAPWSIPVTPLTAKPGDLVFFAGADPPNGHVGMLLANGLYVHTNRTGDVAHVKALNVAAVTAWRAVDPEKARAVAARGATGDAATTLAAAEDVRARYETAARDLDRIRHDLVAARAERSRVAKKLGSAKNKQTIAARRREDARKRLNHIAARAYIHASSGDIASVLMSVDSVEEFGRSQVLLRAAGTTTGDRITAYEEARDAAVREERELSERLDAVDARIESLLVAKQQAQAVLAENSADPATPILGSAHLRAADLVAWYRSTGQKVRTKAPIDEIARTYLAEGKRAGVRGDMAFAQAVFDTAYFTFPATGALPGTDNNVSLVGGCNTCQSIPWYGSVTDAIRAHVQLLRVYADAAVTRDSLGSAPVVPGVLDTHTKGTVLTWSRLPGMALHAPEYGTGIAKLYSAIATWVSTHQR